MPKKVRILFFNSLHQDYLSDSLLIGLKSLDNVEIVEYPGNNYIYKSDIFEDKQNKFYGNGFSLYNLVDPKNQIKPLKHPFDYSTFDLFIFSNIQDQFGLFLQLRPLLNSENTIVMDGSDSPSIYPYAGYYWRRPYYWFLPRIHNRFKYFKREWTPETVSYRWYKLIPKGICELLNLPIKLYKISFSIPAEKIIGYKPQKKKDFPKHIVDQEVCSHVEGSYTTYAFEDEKDYYQDLQDSRFGITTKRAGWDCMRHYEIAANGAVICFRGLDKKPSTCAPHGLVPGINCISYKSYADLISQINNLTLGEYESMQSSSLEWVHQNSCHSRAKELITLS